MIKSIEFDEAQVSPGAIACSSEAILVGTLKGYAKFGYPDLRLKESSHKIFNSSCDGVQLTPDGVIVLGRDVEKSQQELAAVKDSIQYLTTAGSRLRFDLPHGNWRMVKGLEGSLVILYDTNENEGMAAIDVAQQKYSWRIPLKTRRSSQHNHKNLLAIQDKPYIRQGVPAIRKTIFILNLETGETSAEYELPPQDFVVWTAAAKFHESLLLGGFLCSERDYVIAQWDPVKKSITRVATYQLEEFFSLERIQRAYDDECCGIDIFDVAAIHVSEDQSTAVVAFGGDGERLGACQGASALALIDTENFSIRSKFIVDLEDGTSGLVVAPDGGIILNCGSSVHVVLPDELKALSTPLVTDRGTAF